MKVFEPLPPDIEHLAKVVVDAAYRVHTTLGPGLLESVYEICLMHELGKREIGTFVPSCLCGEVLAQHAAELRRPAVISGEDCFHICGAQVAGSNLAKYSAKVSRQRQVAAFI
jgi:hypothetical protein